MTAAGGLGYRQNMMRSLSIRSASLPSSVLRPLTLALTLCALPLGCTPKHKPEPIKPPPPPGDLLRLVHRSGEKVQGKIAVRYEEGEEGNKKKQRIFAVLLKEEHTITNIDESGTMHMAASFLEPETQGDSPKEKKTGEALARALSEVKITYDITPRGDVTNFDVTLGKEHSAVLKPTRQIAQWVYGADRGPLFDPGPIEVAKDWTIRAQIPIPQGGSKNYDITCTYDKREKDEATLSMNGKVSGESQGIKVSGELKQQLRLNVPQGRVLYSDVDTTQVFRSGDQESGGSMMHVHITWEATGEPPAPDGKGTAIVP